MVHAIRRRGTATTELVFCVPLLFTLIFGSIEACNAITLRQTLTVAAYEGMLQATARDAEESNVLQRVQDMLSARNVSAQSIHIGDDAGNTVAIADLEHGDIFQISITVVVAANIPPPRLFYLSPTMSVSVVGQKQ